MAPRRWRNLLASAGDGKNRESRTGSPHAVRQFGLFGCRALRKIGAGATVKKR